MINSVSHLPAGPIDIRGRVIQRCAICGEKLVDSKRTMVPIGDAGKPYPTWEPGVMVRVIKEGNVSRWESVECETIEGENGERDRQKLPEDSCIDLVE